MKKLLFLFFLIPIVLNAQPENRKLLAHYPLNEHFGDVTGQEDSLETSHVFIDNEGLYIDGANPATDTANIIQTTIESLDVNDFYISLEVKPDSIPEDGVLPFIRYAFVCGLGSKWMNIILNQRFKSLFLAHSGGGGINSTNYALNQWYQFALSYDRETGIGNFYVDGEIAITEIFDLEAGDNKTIGLGRFDGRWPMKGHWKNLQIFGPQGSAPSPLSVMCTESSPASNNETFDATISLEISGGTAPYHVDWNGGDTIFYEEGIYPISNLGTGMYNVLVIDSLSGRDSCETIITSYEDPISSRKLLAHYPLDTHLGDVTGQEDTLETAHVKLDEEGLYIDGADPNTDTSNLTRVTIEALDLDDFYISLDVKLDSVPNDGIQSINQRHIFVGGLGWKWMRAIVNQQFDFITLGTPNRESPWLPFEFDQWYTFGLYYDRENLEGRFYIDGELQFILDDLDLKGMDDRRLGIGTNSGPWPMKGHWKNLMIYGPDTRIEPLSFSCSEDKLPTDGNSEDGSIQIEITGGTPPYQLNWNGGDTSILSPGIHLISHLEVGTYSFNISDSLRIQDSCKTSLVFPLSLPLIAHYPLQGDGKDALGLNDDMILENVEFLDSALYIDGADSFSDTANRVTVSRLDQLNFDHFQVDIDFKLDSITGGIADRIIWMGGFGARWITLAYNTLNKEIKVAYNSSTRNPTNYFIEYGRWYNASVAYNRATQELSLWMDGQKIYEAIVDLFGGSDKSIFVDCQCGPRPMKGFWRNLKVYSHSNAVADLQLSNQITEWTGTATSNDGGVQVDITGGLPPYQAILNDDQGIIEERTSEISKFTFDALSVGSYTVAVTDALDSTQIINFELLPPQTALPILSFYPFDTDLADTSGTHLPMTLSNVQHIVGEGLNLPGNNNDIMPLDQIRTIFSDLNPDDFYISLNVTIDSIEDSFAGDRSIFLMGGAWKWMYPVYFQPSKEIKLRHNEIQTSPGSFSFEFGREYEIAMSYNKSEGIGKLFINRMEVIRDTFEIQPADHLAFEMNCNCGPRPMKGFWRKLRLYSAPDSMVTSTREIGLDNHLKIYPNPSSSHLFIEVQESSLISKPILLFDTVGRIVKKIDVDMNRVHTITISDLEPGMYWIKIGDAITKFIKL